MYWYLVGAAVSAVVLFWIRNRWPGRKNWQKAVLFFMGTMAAAFLVEWSDAGKRGQEGVLRNEPGKGSIEQKYLLNVEDILEEYTLPVTIEEQKLSKEQRTETFEQARQELDECILGENISREEIQSNLYLPETLQEGAVEVTYRFSDYQTFFPDGTLRAEVDAPVLVEITAEMICQEETSLYSFYIKAVPSKKSVQEQFVDKVKEALKEENIREDTKLLVLPEEVDGKRISWKKQKESVGIILVFLGGGGAICILLMEKEQKKKREKEQQEQMLMDYPEIISKLVQLLGAGMNTGMAWEKIVTVYQKRKREGKNPVRYAYEEMAVTLHEIQDGVGEIQAYQRFGEHCRLAGYRRLSSLLVQNLKRGNREIQSMLESEAREAFEERKARVKKMGEEAGTKLLLPMMLMLVVVLVILVVPAGMAMNL